MLTESRPYKDHLLRVASKLDLWHDDNAWTPARSDSYEREILSSFFMIRRLIECNKLSEEIVARSLPIQQFRPTGKRVTLWSRYDIDELYNLEQPIRARLTLPFVCNQIVHSYVFALFIDGTRRTSSFLFSSDRQRRKAAYRMTRGTYVRLLRRVGRNYPRLAEFEFDEQKGDYRVRMSDKARVRRLAR